MPEEESQMSKQSLHTANSQLYGRATAVFPIARFRKKSDETKKKKRDRSLLSFFTVLFSPSWYWRYSRWHNARSSRRTVRYTGNMSSAPPSQPAILSGHLLSQPCYPPFRFTQANKSQHLSSPLKVTWRFALPPSHIITSDHMIGSLYANWGGKSKDRKGIMRAAEQEPVTSVQFLFPPSILMQVTFSAYPFFWKAARNFANR